MKQVTCKICGWVHMGVGGSKQTQCFNCGKSYKNMRPAKDGDCPDGCTIQEIRLPETLEAEREG